MHENNENKTQAKIKGIYLGLYMYIQLPFISWLEVVKTISSF